MMVKLSTNSLAIIMSAYEGVGMLFKKACTAFFKFKATFTGTGVIAANFCRAALLGQSGGATRAVITAALLASLHNGGCCVVIHDQ